MLFTHLLTNQFLNAAMLSITTRNLLIEVGFVRCTGPQLLWVILQYFEMLWPKGQPIYYDKLMLGCEEKILEENYFLATKFPTRQTYVYIEYPS